MASPHKYESCFCSFIKCPSSRCDPVAPWRQGPCLFCYRESPQSQHGAWWSVFTEWVQSQDPWARLWLQGLSFCNSTLSLWESPSNPMGRQMIQQTIATKYVASHSFSPWASKIRSQSLGGRGVHNIASALLIKGLLYYWSCAAINFSTGLREEELLKC